jgi:hypothetical protein
LIVTSLAASTAAAGIAAGPVDAATNSGKVYACYSDRTNALYYSNPTTKCGAGFTRISWSKRGPQGAQE